ncbi:MAG: serine hydrolase domain-containing protein, partial [Candidatus Thorarchaeota archaeon]
GYIVSEQYWGYRNENTSHHIFSCTKSVTGTLIGVAINEGFLDNVSQRVLAFFPEMTFENPDPLKDSMTIEHLLTMTHGLDWNEWNCSYTVPENMYNQMFTYSSDPIQFFLDLPIVNTPGEQWVYTTGASHILSAIIQRATGMTTEEFAEEYLFGPMDASIPLWSSFNGVNNGGTLLYLTPRTFAKLGLLYLNNGSWNGQQILTEDYVIAATSPQTSIPGADESYGYQWWLDSEYQAFGALGSEGQMLFVNPANNTVIVLTAGITGGPDLAYDVLNRVIQSIREFDPTAVTQTENETTTVGAETDPIQPLVVVGLVSIPVALLIIGVLFMKRKITYGQ